MKEKFIHTTNELLSTTTAIEKKKKTIACSPAQEDARQYITHTNTHTHTKLLRTSSRRKTDIFPKEGVLNRRASY